MEARSNQNWCSTHKCTKTIIVQDDTYFREGQIYKTRIEPNGLFLENEMGGSSFITSDNRHYDSFRLVNLS